MNTLTSLSPAELDQLARKRAGAKMGWFIHALVYALVNVGLALLATLQGKPWAVYPALGWGVGLAVHGLVVFVKLQNFSLFDRLLQRERQRIQAQRDPW